VYGSDLEVQGVRKALSAAKPDRSPDFQAESGSPAGTR
jgi:hypothetical protein